MSSASRNLDRILALPTKFFVDIGAANDPNESQTEVLLANGWSGVMFECNPDKVRPLAARLAGKPVAIVPEKVTPDTIVNQLRAHSVPPDFFLSLDIDGYDYFVLKAILGAFRPQYIISEINEKIPPPMKFTVLYRPDYWWSGWHFYGYSLSMLEDLLPAHGYKVESVDRNNAIIVPGTQETPLHELYDQGYFARPGWARFPYNRDFDPMYTLPYSEQCAFVLQKFASFQGQYSLDGTIPIANTGQIQMTQPFGQCLATVAADPRFTRYLEIGTWNGRGSTYCLHEGFKGRTDSPVLQSYEIHKARCAEAAALWASVPSIRVLYGRVLPNDQCPTYREVSQRFPTANSAWHREDVENFWGSPYIPPEDPEVVLFDGAEYLTWYEFDRVFKTMPSVRVFLLDDTKTDKTPAIAAYLSEHPEWIQTAGSDTERNGWAMFERRPREDQTEETT